MTNDSTPRALGPTLAVAQYHLARRELDQARDILIPLAAADAAASVAPRERQALAETLAALAQRYADRRQLAPASELLELAQPLADTAPVWHAAAAVAAQRGDPAGAAALLLRVAQAQPESGPAWMELARAYEAAGGTADAVASYLRVATLDQSLATTLALAERLTTLAPPPAPTPAREVRIALLGSATLTYVRSYLEVACRVAGLTPVLYEGDFGQYAQEILQPESGLYAFAPQIIILAIHGRALFPALYDDPLGMDEAARRTAVGEVVERVAGLLAPLTARSPALVLLHTFATPRHSPLGVLDLRDPFGQSALFGAINAELAARVRRDFPAVHLVDEDRVYGNAGKRNVTDPRLWYLARIGVGEGALPALAATYLRYVKAFKGLTRKCLVLDLDNTLWGGVVGEDGPEGIKLGQEAPGNAYRAFQEAILGLYRRGIILAVNSKNNEADALTVLEQHPEMLLRPRHFAAMRINWQDKATNLREIAAELNIGLDSLVFVDDNPAECALVRAQLPEVLTVELPRDPALYRDVLLDLTDFDSLTLTEEDRQRGQLYAERRERQEWEAAHTDAAGTLGDYLRDLGIRVRIERADSFAIPRVAQLIGKTNQFNLTTRRHSEQAVRALAASDAAAVYGVRVADRFGDHGLVGVAITAQAANAWTIDTLLLSCRVLGRGVETALLSTLAADARAAGAQTLRGEFIPTAKNEPAREFYPQHGFHRVAAATAGPEGAAQEWELDLRASDVAPPAWLAIETPAAIE
jgi:FkbH-like protein